MRPQVGLIEVIAAARGRQPQRAAGVGAEAGGNGAVGHGRRRSGRRAAGDAGRVPGVAGMAQHVVVPRRPVGELGQVQRRDLQGAGGLEAGDGGGVGGGRLVGADLGAPAGDLALAVEHVLVGERHAGERPLGAALGDGRIGSLGGGQGLVGLQRDDAVGQLVAGLQALDGGLGRLDAGDLLVADGLRQAPRGESGQVGHGLASCGEHAAEVVDVGAERQLQRDPARRARQQRGVRLGGGAALGRHVEIGGDVFACWRGLRSFGAGHVGFRTRVHTARA